MSRMYLSQITICRPNSRHPSITLWKTQQSNTFTVSHGTSCHLAPGRRRVLFCLVRNLPESELRCSGGCCHPGTTRRGLLTRERSQGQIGLRRSQSSHAVVHEMPHLVGAWRQDKLPCPPQGTRRCMPLSAATRDSQRDELIAAGQMFEDWPRRLWPQAKADPFTPVTLWNGAWRSCRLTVSVRD
jgi:hypothetical protein